MTLDRLTDEHMKCQKLQSMVGIKERQIISTLQVSDKVAKHLSRMQQEDKLWKLDKFANDEFEQNMSVLQQIRMERMAEENEREMNANLALQPSSPIRLNHISEDGSNPNDTSRLTSYPPESTYPASNEGDGAPAIKKRKGSKPRVVRNQAGKAIAVTHEFQDSFNMFDRQ